MKIELIPKSRHVPAEEPSPDLDHGLAPESPPGLTPGPVPAHHTRVHDPLQPHRTRPGDGRGILRRLLALCGMALVIVALGLLLAGIVIGILVVGAFLLETLID